MKVAKSQAVKLLVGAGVKNAGSLNEEKLSEKLENMPKLTDGQLKKLDKDSTNLYKAVRSAIKDEKDITVEADKESKKAKAAKAEADNEEDDEESEESDESEGEEDEGDDEADDEAEEGDEEESEGDEDEGDEEESEESEEDEEEEVTEKKSTKGKKTDKGSKKTEKGKTEKKPAKKKESAPKDKFGMREGTRAARINAAIGPKLKSISQIQKDAKYDKPIHGHMNKLVEGGFVAKVKLKDGGFAYRATGKTHKE